jgi:alkaline phosphatase D
VVLSVWTEEPVLAMMLAQGSGTAWISPDPAPGLDVDALVPEDGHTELTLTGLQPDTVYAICFASEDLSRRSRVTRFRTAMDADGWRVLTFAATSCLGKPGRPWPSMSYVAAADPDAFLLLGDTVYATHASTTEQFLEDYRYALGLEGLAEASAHSAMIAVWDDHEVFNNFAGLTADPALLEAALEAFRSALPQREGPGGNGLWRKLSWGRVADLFLLDCRGERDEESQYISPEQMDWLKESLSASEARFKLIMNSVPITDYTAMLGSTLAEDRWQGYPAQRGEILGHIEDDAIAGVLWLTGDFHMGVISRVDPVGGLAESRWEVLVGAAGSTRNLLASLYDNPEQFPVMFEDWNSVLLRLDPGTGEARVTFIGDDGAVIAEQVLSL